MTSEIEKTIAEIEQLETQATFNVVKQALKELKLKQQTLLEQAKFQQAASTPAAKPSNSIISRPLTKLTTYAYDESDKFVKLYYTLNGVQSIPAESVKYNFTEDSFDITVHDLNGRDYSIIAKGFAHPIDPKNSVIKQKSDMLLVMLKKASTGTWSELLKLEKQKKEEQKLKEADPGLGSGDPQDAMMKLMKQLYDQGDDDMKRKLRQSWHESRAGKAPGGMPPMPDLDF